MPYTDQEKPIELMVNAQLGIQNALAPTSLPSGAYLVKKNAMQTKVGSNAKRMGSCPVTSVALAAVIQYLTEYRTTPTSSSLLAASGTTLYKYDGASTLTAQTMTNALAKSDIYTIAFTNENLISILFITDGGNMKQYDGSAVADITPAADDPSPASTNAMAAINALAPIYTWVYGGHVMVSDGSFNVYYSKKYIFDYFPDVYYLRWNRNNDYITGCGVSYGNICLVPMRKGWGIFTGTDFSNYADQLFLNTISGNVAPRAIAKLTYPDGSQTVAYLSDDGYYEVYDTGFIDSSGSGTRNLATRSLMKNKVDFISYGFTAAEMTATEAYFDSTLNLYISTIKRDTINYAFIYDVRNREWELWDNIRAESTIRFNNVLYYAGSTKLLHKYDATLATDYDDFAQTTGTVVDHDNYTDVIMLENTGFQSMFDYLIVNTKNFPTTSTWEITIVGTSDTTVLANAVLATYATWDKSLWDFCIIVNTDFTSIVGAPVRIKLKKKAYFIQIRFRNNKNELTELYSYRLIGRSSGG